MNTHPQIQQHLIKDSMAALAQHLYAWLVAKDGTVPTPAAAPPTATALYPTSALSHNAGVRVLRALVHWCRRCACTSVVVSYGIKCELPW
jgi:hypothetical protein